MEIRNVNSMSTEQFINNLSSENLSYIKDSFDSIESALKFYQDSAIQSAGNSLGEFQDINKFFAGLSNLSSTDFV